MSIPAEMPITGLSLISILMSTQTNPVLNGQGGELVAVLRGANAPLLQRMIVEELTKEKLVLEQGGERKVVSYQQSAATKYTQTLTNTLTQNRYPFTLVLI